MFFHINPNYLAYQLRPPKYPVMLTITILAAFAVVPCVAQGSSLFSFLYTHSLQSGSTAPTLPWWAGAHGSNTTSLLAAVQGMPLFSDSKTFVDMPLLTTPSLLEAAWSAFPKPFTFSSLSGFVAKHFGEAGSEWQQHLSPCLLDCPPLSLPLPSLCPF